MKALHEINAAVARSEFNIASLQRWSERIDDYIGRAQADLAYARKSARKVIALAERNGHDVDIVRERHRLKIATIKVRVKSLKRRQSAIAGFIQTTREEVEKLRQAAAVAVAHPDDRKTPFATRDALLRYRRKTKTAVAKSHNAGSVCPSVTSK